MSLLLVENSYDSPSADSYKIHIRKVKSFLLRSGWRQEHDLGSESLRPDLFLSEREIGEC